VPVRALIAIATAVAVLGAASPASAFDGGGRKPSDAPLISFGQRYSGQLNNHRSDANYGSFREVALWRLPPVSSHDLIVVNWHSVPSTRSPGEFPVCMVLAQGIDDFSWGGVFGKTTEYESCDDRGPLYSVSASGTAQTAITVQETNAASTYLEFTAFSNETDPGRLETFPYDFSVEAPRHYLGLTVKPVKQIRANGILHASVTLTDGSPAPDGLVFGLSATWNDGGVATASAATVGGQLGFALALPEAAIGKQVAFVVSRAADSAFQAVSSTKLRVPVKMPSGSSAESACETAQRRSHTLARQFNRVSRRASQAHGQRRRALKRQARQVGRKLRNARAATHAACGS
jgi:hypothetical protein